ncbi:hypothetical protein CBOM_05407 [Ceraceosorus bombacis]|uniref:Uncharacterized protein n=1 Tax=Ceraceosorus bombacis TaxID=401625 RepID=A0A0P1BQ29_9BASI|nr:hypothetical protein CBOM_05407 [Ceraceosorus bombacis]
MAALPPGEHPQAFHFDIVRDSIQTTGGQHAVITQGTHAFDLIENFFNALQQEHVALQQEYVALQQKNVALQQENMALQQEYVALQQKNVALQQENMALQQENVKQHAEISDAGVKKMCAAKVAKNILKFKRAHKKLKKRREDQSRKKLRLSTFKTVVGGVACVVAGAGLAFGIRKFFPIVTPSATSATTMMVAAAKVTPKKSIRIRLPPTRTAHPSPSWY